MTEKQDTTFFFGTREICPQVFYRGVHRRRFQLFPLASFNRTSSANFPVSYHSVPLCLPVKLPARADLCFGDLSAKEDTFDGVWFVSAVCRTVFRNPLMTGENS